MFFSDRSAILLECEKEGIFVFIKWFPELEECVPKAPKIFIGNKIDLREEYQKKCKDPKSAPIAR